MPLLVISRAASDRLLCLPGPFLTDISKAWDLEATNAGLKRTSASMRAGQPDEVVG